jgi:hypothetical protein
MKLYIIHENSEWMDPIRTALVKQNVDFTEWDMSQDVIYAHLHSIPPEGVFYNRISPSSFTRGNISAIDHTKTILRWLEQHNRKIINPISSFEIEISKTAQYLALTKTKINTPRTQILFGKKALEDTANITNFPFVIKANRGGKGIGVFIIKNIFELRSLLANKEKLYSPDEIYLIQELIISPNNKIFRAEFIGGKFIYLVEVDTSQGLNLCPADSCNIEDRTSREESKLIQKFNIITDYTDPIIHQYESLLNEYKIDTAGIEFCVDKQGYKFTYDINVTTNYNQEAEKATMLSCYDTLAAFLKREAEI